MAAASSRNLPAGDESTSEEEGGSSDDQCSFASSSGGDSDEEFGVGCESREGSEDDASEQSEQGDQDEFADRASDDEDDAAADETTFECVLCSRQLKEDHGISFTCDGNCGRELGAMDKRFTCVGRGCEFDICKPCMTAHTASVQEQPVPMPAVCHAPMAAAAAHHSEFLPPAPSAAAAVGLPSSAARPALRPVARGDMPSLARRMDHFMGWQQERAKRALERAGPASVAAPAAPAATPAGATADASLPVLAAVERTTAQVAPTPELPTPPTAPYGLQPPLEIIQISEPGPPLQRQVAALLAAGGESRRRALALAREVLRQLPSEDGADEGAMLGGSLGADEPARRPATPRRPPTSMQVALPPSRPALSLQALTYQVRCFCCDDEIGGGDARKCASLLLPLPPPPTPTPTPLTPHSHAVPESNV
jgi:hypothetical protein